MSSASSPKKSIESSGAAVSKLSSQQRPVSEKPPPVPVKRKKKVEKSFENLMGQTKMDLKRAKLDETPVVVTKPPIPPKPDRLKLQQSNQNSAHAKDIQNRTLLKLKRKTEETNQAMVQKLNCYIEQMRLEIHDLKSSLVAEKNAVRTLR